MCAKMCNLALKFVVVSCICLFNTSASRLVRVHNRVSSNLRREYVPPHRDHRFILRCLNGQDIPEHRREQCRAMEDVVSRMAELRALNRRRRICKSFPVTGDITGLQQEYIKDIALINNAVPESGAAYNTLKDNVASCANYSSLVRNQWKGFHNRKVYKGRKVGINISPVSQELNSDEVEAVFDPISDRTRFQSATPMFADLILLRAAPCQIDERYGTYEIVVQMVENERTLQLYHAEQASCPSLEGYLMVVNLDLQPIWHWVIGSTNSTLKLRIRVRPIEQVLTGSRSSNEVVQVLRRALALTVMARKPPGAPKKRLNQPSALLPNMQRNGRSRRHAVAGRASLISTAACHRVSYSINFDAKFQRNIAYPVSFDIGECIGKCPFPLSERMNSTNHAVAMKMEQVFNPTPPVHPTVDCVPTNLGDIVELEFDSEGNIVLDTLDEVVVNQCGCL